MIQCRMDWTRRCLRRRYLGPEEAGRSGQARDVWRVWPDIGIVCGPVRALFTLGVRGLIAQA